MKKVEATINPFDLDAVRDALIAEGVVGMNVCEVQGLDPRTRPAHFRGTEYVVWFKPQYKIELVVADEQVARCIDAIRNTAQCDDTSGVGIVVLPIDDTMQIRTGDHLKRAA